MSTRGDNDRERREGRERRSEERSEERLNEERLNDTITTDTNTTDTNVTETNITDTNLNQGESRSERVDENEGVNNVIGIEDSRSSRSNRTDRSSDRTDRSSDRTDRSSDRTDRSSDRTDRSNDSSNTINDRSNDSSNTVNDRSNNSSNTINDRSNNNSNTSNDSSNNTSNTSNDSSNNTSNTSNDRPNDSSNTTRSNPGVSLSNNTNSDLNLFDNSFMENINNLLRETTNRMSENHSSNDEPNGGAIIITINYVFSDENNPQNPNRSGSLVMTLPNSSSNRNPRVIDEFIRLATQMAYSTIMNDHRPTKGISVEKFNTFDIKSFDQLQGNHQCSICLENYEMIEKSESSNSNEDIETPAKKRRKLNDSSSFPQSDTSSDSKPLSECTIEFPHFPIEMPCKHVFGKSCLAEWLKTHTTCPMCRSSVEEVDGGVEGSGVGGSGVGGSGVGGGGVGGGGVGGSGVGGSGTETHGTGINRPQNNSQTNTQNTQFGPNRNAMDEIEASRPGVFSHILAYLRRPRGESLFPSGVSSSRGENGVNTTEEDIADYLNLRNLRRESEE